MDLVDVIQIRGGVLGIGVLVAVVQLDIAALVLILGLRSLAT